MIYDLYFDVEKLIEKHKHYIRLTGGVAVCGLNTSYTQNILYNFSPPLVTQKRKDFIFPAVTAGIGFQKGPLYGKLKVGYCWNDPRLYNTPFLFPEISLQYHFPQVLKKHR